MRKSIGPNTDPRGTPAPIDIQLDKFIHVLG